eukprot:maker-scaffold_6-snap-gene-16.19-mRNA-1 protein AED:0.00 eAED:0.00 QI:30/1/1/1/0/0/2/177/96
MEMNWLRFYRNHKRLPMNWDNPYHELFGNIFKDEEEPNKMSLGPLGLQPEDFEEKFGQGLLGDELEMEDQMISSDLDDTYTHTLPSSEGEESDAGW